MTPLSRPLMINFIVGKISRDNVAATFIEVLENNKTYQKVYTVSDGNTPISKAFKGKDQCLKSMTLLSTS